MGSVASATRQRVLLVDDDPTLLEVLTTALHLEELDVIPAPDGETALQVAADGAVDLVVCDVGMPDPDGLEVCRRLKSDPRTQDLPVILLTGRDTDEDRSRGQAAGCDAYVTKPFSPLELLELIRQQRAGETGGGA
jgi:DNA-binding response OmpR family regulator